MEKRSFNINKSFLFILLLFIIKLFFATDGTGNAEAANNTPSEVYAYNEATGKTELQPVNHVFVNEDPEITLLTIYDPETTQSEYITTTPEHPFYLAGNVDNSSRPKPENHGELSNKWVGAGHLKTGDKLRQADGTLGEVRYVNTITQTRTMYNLSVQEAHTFFVGSHSWLVHNTKWPCNPVSNLWKGGINTKILLLTI